MVDNVNIINLNFDSSNLPNGFTGLAIYPNGLKEWFLNGKHHRVDGPAIEYADGSKQWFLNGKRHRVDGPAYEDTDGEKAWYLNGEIHRVDGPAIEYADGSKAWYLNGKRHRVDGPAIEYADGSKQWLLNGKCHREDGPASIDTDGTIEWYLNGSPIFYLFLTLDYIVISEGMPCDIEWMGRPVKAYKVLTTRGIEFMPDLPGMRDILFARQ